MAVPVATGLQNSSKKISESRERMFMEKCAKPEDDVYLSVHFLLAVKFRHEVNLSQSMLVLLIIPVSRSTFSGGFESMH